MGTAVYIIYSLYPQSVNYLLIISAFVGNFPLINHLNKAIPTKIRAPPNQTYCHNRILILF